MRILFITATRVGDAVLSTGLLKHLVETHPGARVTVACGPAAAGLFEAVPGLEKLIVLDKMLWSLHWVRLWALAIAKRWDVLVDLRNSSIYYTLPAKRRYRMGRSRDDAHRIRQLARVLGLENDPPAPRIWLSEEQRALAERLIPGGGPVLAVGPTANWRAKTWPADSFTDLVGRLTAPTGILPGARVAVFGRDDERPQALPLIDSIPPERRIDLVGHLELSQVAACVERAAFYVGNDSGLMHLAAAVGVPTLGLFGPSREDLYAPWGENTALVRTPEAFGEIFPENFDHRNSGTLMGSLSVDAVEQAARSLWARTKGNAA
jgi:ADP-heptose:LPS heptosyltransferase